MNVADVPPEGIVRVLPDTPVPAKVPPAEPSDSVTAVPPAGAGWSSVTEKVEASPAVPDAGPERACQLIWIACARWRNGTRMCASPRSCTT